ncbi:hypothetical protein P9112_012939 [Eukaryota sp. TZLM1-RC]
MEPALSLLQRLPPSEVQTHLDNVLELISDEAAVQLLPLVDQPLVLKNDSTANKQFLCCDFNRDGDSHRSPFSNDYFPDLPDGVRPSEAIRKIEVAANDAFDTYRHLYFEGGYSSVYLWEHDQVDGGIGACVLIKKEVDPDSPISLGNWDSVHVFTITPKEHKKFHYQLDSTILLTLKTTSTKTGQLDLEGTLTRKNSSTMAVSGIHTHVSNMGSMVENMENMMRDQLEGVYFDRSRDILTSLHREAPEIKRDAMITDLRNALLSRKVA